MWLLIRLGSIVLLCGLSGCGDTPDREARAEACPPSVTGNGSEQKTPHPEEPSQCKVVVMTCNACVYDRDGRFSKVETEVCGVCIGTSF
jgi:hypothetical protein